VTAKRKKFTAYEYIDRPPDCVTNLNVLYSRVDMCNTIHVS